MKILGFEIRRETGNLTLSNPEQWLVDALCGRPTSTGVAVNENTSLAIPAVYSCVSVLARSVASLPLNLFAETKTGRQKATNHPLYSVLHDSPNSEMTSYSFRESMMMNLLLRGNAFAEIARDGAGRVTELFPIPADYVQMKRNQAGAIVYEVRVPGFDAIILQAKQMLHVAGMCFDGLYGKSPIQVCRDSMSIAIAAEQYGGKFFANGAKLSGVLETAGKLSTEAHARLKETWNTAYNSLTGAMKTAILENGLTYKTIGIPPGDAQYIETRKFQTEEIARIFNVPLFLIQSQEKSTAWGSGIEQLNIAFVTHHLRPWLVRWEQCLNMRLLTDSERGKYCTEFLVDGLLRGDTKSRYEAYSIARQNGWMSVNEIRGLENLNAVEGGDVYLEPLNMVQSGTRQNDGNTSNSNNSNRSALPVEKRDAEDVASAVRPFYIDALNRIIKRSKADLSRKLSKIDSEASSILNAYYTDEFPQFCLQSILPVYSGFVSGLGKGDANIMAASATSRLTADCLDVALKSAENSQNIAASVDGALQAVLSNTAQIADKEINIVLNDFNNGGDNAEN